MERWSLLLAGLAGALGACTFDPGGLLGGEIGGPGGDTDTPPEAPWQPERVCYYGGDPMTPAATVEHALEVLQGVAVVHIRLTLDPRFVDNTYGATAMSWPGKGHTFKDLVGSDHAQLQLWDGAGALVSELRVDYLSADASAPSGYADLGVRGGDGGMILGDPSIVVATSTSLARNLNERGLVSYTVDSPATDASYTPNPAAPDWDFRVIYELAVRADAFGPAGFGDVTIASIHASPSKLGENTVVVDPRPCPPDWDGYCNDPDGCDPGSGLPTCPGAGCDPPPSCTQDSDCGPGELCEDGACLPTVG
jgi:hypothetical protein